MRLRWNSALLGADNQYPSSAYQMVSSFSLIIAIMSAISINHIPSVCIFITITTVSTVLSQPMLCYYFHHYCIFAFIGMFIPTSMMYFLVSVLPGIFIQIIISLHYNITTILSNITTSTYTSTQVTFINATFALLPVPALVSVLLVIHNSIAIILLAAS